MEKTCSYKAFSEGAGTKLTSGFAVEEYPREELTFEERLDAGETENPVPILGADDIVEIESVVVVDVDADEDTPSRES